MSSHRHHHSHLLAHVSACAAPTPLQVLAVLEAMGGTLKADDAELAYKQEKKAKLARSAADLVRVTAMFSATMPPAVEKMAKKYLRHPAVVQVCVCVCAASGERFAGAVPLAGLAGAGRAIAVQRQKATSCFGGCGHEWQGMGVGVYLFVVGLGDYCDAACSVEGSAKHGMADFPAGAVCCTAVVLSWL